MHLLQEPSPELQRALSDALKHTRSTEIFNWTIHPGVHWREAILNSDMNQRTVANLVGVDRSHLSHILTGKKLPSAELVVKLAQVLDLPVGMMWQLQSNYVLDIALGKPDVTTGGFDE